ncbi:MAG: ribosome-associated translation inhibitor RaiA [Bacteroidota bacterium]
MKVHTQSVHFSADQKLLAFIERKLSKLDQFFDRIVSAKVLLKLENSGQIRDKIAEVRLEIPGTILFVKETNKSFEASIDLAIDSLRRQLIKYKERLRAKKH